jgi:predicted transposase/invertase (TIGR01784 family)
MQNARPMNFANRLIFYSTYPIRNQAPARKRKEKNGEKPQLWHYDLKAIYIVAIVNFPMLGGKTSEDIVIDWVQLMSVKTKRRFSDKLNIVIVDLTKFDKSESELKTLRDYWLYTLKHAETLIKRPENMKNELFMDLYDDILRTNKLTQEEMKAYNNSVMELKNLSLFTDYAKMEGMEIGEKRGEKRGIEIGEKRGEKRGVEIAQIQIVISAADKGISIDDISGFTGLSVERISNILENRK